MPYERGRIVCRLILASAALIAGCSAKRPAVEDRVQAIRMLDRSDLDRAVVLAADGAYAEAAAMLEPLARALEGTGEPHWAEAAFWLAYCREKQDLTGEAVELYELVQMRQPGSEFSDLARMRLAAIRSVPPAEE